MIGVPHVHHRVTDSTNERARELAVGGAPHGTLVTADEQTAGRGRQGRSWVAPPGSALLASVIVRGLTERHSLLPLAAAVAVCEACDEAGGVRCTIKWPNDVWLERRKLAGILVEGRPQEGWAALGFGVNVAAERDHFPAELRETATSLRAAAGSSSSVAELRALVCERLEHWLARGADDVLGAWRARDALRGERVRWNGGEGTASGVDERGALLVRTDAGELALDAGEVHLLR